MSKRKLPPLAPANLSAVKNKIDQSVLARWDKTLVSADGKNNTISIFDVIGSDYFGEGFTAKRMSAALRAIGEENDVVVSINSPGGDFFEGAAIYNLLAQHKGHVTVDVIGMAASAASVIAMAGDTIRISQVGFFMVHNAWGLVVGNRHDMTQAAETFQVFDASMRDLYAARTGMDQKQVEKLMDAETWLNAQDAVDQGFAAEIIQVKAGDEKDTEKRSKAMAMRTIELALAHQGISRKEREEILQKVGVRDAADPAARDTGDGDVKAWEELLNTMRS